jgi:hypothetical protein
LGNVHNMKILTEILIDCSTDQVWKALTDFEKHPEWNPFIKLIEGKPVPNEKLKVHIQSPGSSNAMKFNPRVIAAVEGKELRWKGKLFVPGLFDGEHYFLLKPEANNKTLLIHGEYFSGILVPLFKSMLKSTKEGFELMNLALKRRVEAKS